MNIEEIPEEATKASKLLRDVDGKQVAGKLSFSCEAKKAEIEPRKYNNPKTANFSVFFVTFERQPALGHIGEGHRERNKKP